MPLDNAPDATTMVGDSAAMNPFKAHQKADDDEASVSDFSQEELHENTVFPVADEHGNKAHYPGENEHENVPEKAPKGHSVIGSAIESIKYLYSLALLIFSVVVGIITEREGSLWGNQQYNNQTGTMEKGNRY